jgi:hypothetical protein
MLIGKIKAHKWRFIYCLLGILISSFIYVAIKFEDKAWLPNALQTIGTTCGFFLSLLIFFKSNEDSNRQFNENLEHLQRLNAEHISALQIATERQISNSHELNSIHINVLRESTQNQIKAIQELTDKQIHALHSATNSQIDSFEKELSEVVTRLTDNSIILGEILGRELEKSIDHFNNMLAKERRLYEDDSAFKLLRTEEERQRQIRKRLSRIAALERVIKTLKERYKNVREFLGYGANE